MKTITFSDEKFLTAEDKGKILKTWQRFIQSGFTERAFTKSLYQHIVGHCDFIAHYNRSVFYVTYFDDLHDFKKFWNQFGGNHRMAEGYGTDFRDVIAWGAATAIDLNQAMVAYAKQVNGTIMQALRAYETLDRSGEFSTSIQSLIADTFRKQQKNKTTQPKEQMALF